jgi:hypothetical protein
METKSPALMRFEVAGAGIATLQSLMSAGPEALQRLTESIDESPYPIEAWLAALERFAEWEKANQRRITLDSKREYLSCCIEGIKSPNASAPLPEMLEHYLKEHGVTG